MQLPQLLATVPRYTWSRATQMFDVEVSSADGVVCQRYAIPRHVFFAILAAKKAAMQECLDADDGADIIQFGQADSG